MRKTTVIDFEKPISGSEETESVKISVKHTLSLDDMLGFVDNVYECCVDITEGTYMPEVYDFAVRESLIRFYTDFEIAGDLSDKYDLLYSTELYDNVLDQINQNQFAIACDSAEKKIKYAVDTMTGVAALKSMSVLEKLSQSLKEGFGGIDVDNLARLAQRLNGVKDEDLAAELVKEVKSGNSVEEKSADVTVKDE